jgi:hypothetical protein
MGLTWANVQLSRGNRKLHERCGSAEGDQSDPVHGPDFRSQLFTPIVVAGPSLKTADCQPFHT